MKTDHRIDGISYDRIHCAEFWFMFYSCNDVKSDSNTPKFYYESIFPHLLGRDSDINENLMTNFDNSGDFFWENYQISAGTCAVR